MALIDAENASKNWNNMFSRANLEAQIALDAATEKKETRPEMLRPMRKEQFDEAEATDDSNTAQRNLDDQNSAILGNLAKNNDLKDVKFETSRTITTIAPGTSTAQDTDTNAGTDGLNDANLIVRQKTLESDTKHTFLQSDDIYASLTDDKPQVDDQIAALKLKIKSDSSFHGTGESTQEPLSAIPPAVQLNPKDGVEVVRQRSVKDLFKNATSKMNKIQVFTHAKKKAKPKHHHHHHHNSSQDTMATVLRTMDEVAQADAIKKQDSVETVDGETRSIAGFGFLKNQLDNANKLLDAAGTSRQINRG